MVSPIISSIRGTLEDAGTDWVDVAVGGVTFRVSVPASVADELGGRGDTVRLHTSLQVREDSLNLYGFLTPEMRLAFEALVAVNGIGPRLALSVLSRFTPDSLASAVSSSDTNAFAAVPGVGKKTASRIILELKGKLDIAPDVSPVMDGDGEVVEALAALGYSAAEVRRALSTLPRDQSTSLEDRVRQVLQHLASG